MACMKQTKASKATIMTKMPCHNKKFVFHLAPVEACGLNSSFISHEINSRPWPRWVADRILQWNLHRQSRSLSNEFKRKNWFHIQKLSSSAESAKCFTKILIRMHRRCGWMDVYETWTWIGGGGKYVINAQKLSSICHKKSLQFAIVHLDDLEDVGLSSSNST